MTSKQLSVHLISDQGVDSLTAVFKESTCRFKSVDFQENIWPFTNTEEKLKSVKLNIRKRKSFVLYTIKENAIRESLKSFCRNFCIPCIPVLSRVIRELSSYLKEVPSDYTDQEYQVFTDDYFVRIDAMNYVLSHDDGQNMWDLEEADVIIVGVSRTSKSPTSVYLCHRGYKVANVPFVNNVPIPQNLALMKEKLIVGLTINPLRLTEIRKNRASVMQDNNELYSAQKNVLEEVENAKKFFAQNNWPIIDVTNRSVEEIAAEIIKEYNAKKRL